MDAVLRHEADDGDHRRGDSDRQGTPSRPEVKGPQSHERSMVDPCADPPSRFALDAAAFNEDAEAVSHEGNRRGDVGADRDGHPTHPLRLTRPAYRRRYRPADLSLPESFL
jgi:hypothetical protein